MYVIILYDADAGRVARINKFLKTYLYWRQNSVFEGEVSPPQLEKIRSRLKEIIDKEGDSILIYKFPGKKSFDLEVIGIDKNPIKTIF